MSPEAATQQGGGVVCADARVGEEAPGVAVADRDRGVRTAQQRADGEGLQVSSRPGPRVRDRGVPHPARIDIIAGGPAEDSH